MDTHIQPGNPTTLGVGLISVGWMGRLHTRAYQSIPVIYPELGVHTRLVHATDTAEDRAAYARDVLGYARSSLDYRDVLADPEVDVVSICAPNHMHREIAIAAAEAARVAGVETSI
jgi:predicted dehydrogenase